MGLDAPLRECSACGELKPPADFSKGNMKDGLHSRCRPCNAKAMRTWQKANPEKKAFHGWTWRLRALYGITPEMYAEMVQAQGGVCRICQRPAPNGRRLDVDHCHETGRVRGLLCNGCNRAIGHLAHDPAMLQRAIEYLSTV